MKKIILACLAFLTAIILAAYAGYAVNTSAPAPPEPFNTERVVCIPPLTPAAMPFAWQNYYRPSGVMIRKNIYSLTPAEITAIKTGIAAMKALPVTNKTSWAYQAAIHGTTLSNNLPSWNSCQHGTQFFYSWHRMYLYFFERILRAKSGSADLTLPYWNYQTNAALHPDYRNSAAGNTLYDGTRNSSINNGGSLGPGPMTSINNALNHIPFYDFQGAIEGPHGSIHVAIGGNMGAVNRAATDPVFWLHHSNIDRLWEAWLRKCGGRSNPTDATWLNKTYTFFDENGTAVNMTGSQVVSTASSLNYRYDFPPMIACNIKIDWAKWKWRHVILLKKDILIPVNQKITRAAFKTELNDTVAQSIRINKSADKLRFSSTAPSDKLLVTLGDIEVNKMPEGVVEVYLNLPPNVTPSPDSKYFAGVLDLFSLSAGMAHRSHKGGNDLSIDASHVARSLELSLSAMKNAQLSFYVRGNTVRGKEVPTTADIRIKRTNFALQVAQRQ